MGNDIVCSTNHTLLFSLLGVSEPLIIEDTALPITLKKEKTLSWDTC